MRKFRDVKEIREIKENCESPEYIEVSFEPCRIYLHSEAMNLPDELLSKSFLATEKHRLGKVKFFNLYWFHFHKMYPDLFQDCSNLEKEALEEIREKREAAS